MEYEYPDDPGQLDYSIHNIYLNFVQTYSRLEPLGPITIHQITLFTFWMSCVLFWLLLQCPKIYALLGKPEDGDEENKFETIITNGLGRMTKRLEWRIVGSTKKRNLLLERSVKGIAKIFSSTDEKQPTLESFLAKMIIFGCILFYIWLCDYHHIWPKVNRQYSRDMYLFLFFLLVFVSFLFSIKKTKNKVLNRDQTEEWRGWMQVLFVWYHFFDALEFYNPIRCLVGAYVWMTGFGNYIFFSTRKDYSILRLLQMLFRLNFLVLCIVIVTDQPYVCYYICVMHTYWFLSVWAVMVVMNRFNHCHVFVLFKFAIYVIMNVYIFNSPGVASRIFSRFSWILNDDHESIEYWIYRARMDQWSAIVGMFIAFNFESFENFLNYLDADDPKTEKEREAIRYLITAILLAVFIAWFYYVLLLPRDVYMELHALTSPIPIVIYTWFRNMHPILRTHYLGVFEWLGKITLETYLVQKHIFLMGNEIFIIVYLSQYPMLNFALSTLIHIGVSYVLYHLTVFFRSYLIPQNGKVVIKNIILGTVWYGFCYIIGFLVMTWREWQKVPEKSELELLLEDFDLNYDYT